MRSVNTDSSPLKYMITTKKDKQLFIIDMNAGTVLFFISDTHFCCHLLKLDLRKTTDRGPLELTCLYTPNVHYDFAVVVSSVVKEKSVT